MLTLPLTGSQRQYIAAPGQAVTALGNAKSGICGNFRRDAEASWHQGRASRFRVLCLGLPPGRG